MDKHTPCPEWIEFLPIRDMNELSSAEHQAFTAHLASCLQCRETRERYRYMALLLHTLPSVEPLPASTPQLIRSKSKHSHRFFSQPDSLKTQQLVSQRERRVRQSQESKKKFGLVFSRVISVCVVCLLLLAFALLLHHHPTTLSGSGHTPSPILTPGELYTQVTSGRPVLNDDLSGQDANSWDETGATDFGCAFTGGAYHISISTNGGVQECFAQTTNYSNFAFQAEMTTLSGDGGGLIFRARSINSSSYTSYRFRVSPDGTYDLCVSCGTDLTHILASGRSSSIKMGLGQTNMLTIIAQGGTIYLYVNGHFLEPLISNNVSGYGKIGLFAVDFSQASSVMFRHMKVWNI